MLLNILFITFSKSYNFEEFVPILKSPIINDTRLAGLLITNFDSPVYMHNVKCAALMKYNFTVIHRDHK